MFCGFYQWGAEAIISICALYKATGLLKPFSLQNMEPAGLLVPHLVGLSDVDLNRQAAELNPENVSSPPRAGCATVSRLLCFPSTLHKRKLVSAHGRKAYDS